MASRFFVLNGEEHDALFRPVNGQGGFQDLIHRLQSQFRPGTSELRITPEDIEDIQRYAFDYAQGEDRLMLIFQRHLGPTLAR